MTDRVRLLVLVAAVALTGCGGGGGGGITAAPRGEGNLERFCEELPGLLGALEDLEAVQGNDYDDLVAPFESIKRESASLARVAPPAIRDDVDQVLRAVNDVLRAIDDAGGDVEFSNVRSADLNTIRDSAYTLREYQDARC